MRIEVHRGFSDLSTSTSAIARNLVARNPSYLPLQLPVPASWPGTGGSAPTALPPFARGSCPARPVASLSEACTACSPSGRGALATWPRKALARRRPARRRAPSRGIATGATPARAASPRGWPSRPRSLSLNPATACQTRPSSGLVSTGVDVNPLTGLDTVYPEMGTGDRADNTATACWTCKMRPPRGHHSDVERCQSPMSACREGDLVDSRSSQGWFGSSGGVGPGRSGYPPRVSNFSRTCRAPVDDFVRLGLRGGLRRPIGDGSRRI
jgi:hypothetical protein